jgi:hypothetical protein
MKKSVRNQSAKSALELRYKIGRRLPPGRIDRQRCAADGCQRNLTAPVDRLLVTWLDDGPTHVMAALRANRVSRHRVTALRAVGNLAFLDAIVAAAFAGSTVTVFSLGDSHRCLGG